MTQHTATPDTLANLLATANPHDELFLRGGDYPGEYALRTPHLSLAPYPDELPIFRGPMQCDPTAKPVWLHVYAGATGAQLHDLVFQRDGEIATLYREGWNDFGIVVQAPDTRIERCDLRGMAKALQVKDATSTRCTIAFNVLGPTIDSNLVIGSSRGVNRALLVMRNVFDGSYREDGIHFLPADDADKGTDLSNVGAVIWRNVFGRQNENGIDLKAADRVVIEGNEFEEIAGSNDGAPDWNFNSVATITTGARCITGWVIIRNNWIHRCCAGIRLLFPDQIVYHNDIDDNNWRPEIDNHRGYGIRQPGQSNRPAVVNNLVRNHLAGDLLLTNAEQRGNSSQPGLPGVPLTFTSEAGSGRVLPLADARYFTDYFGRKELAPEQIYIGTEAAIIEAVDYRANTVTLAESTKWQAGQPVFWRVPAPLVGSLSREAPGPEGPPPPIVVEPPIIVEPPTEELETVRLSISAEMTPAEAAQLRGLLAELLYTVTIEPGVTP